MQEAETFFFTKDDRTTTQEGSTMTLKLSNIGLHSDLFMELKPITILTGKNNTGKSTISKVLYALLQGSAQAAERFQMRKQFALEQLMLEATTITAANNLEPPSSYVSDEECISKCIKLLAENENAEAAARLNAKLTELQSATVVSYMNGQIHHILKEEFIGSFKTSGALSYSAELHTSNGDYLISDKGANKCTISPYSNVFYLDDAELLGDFSHKPLYHQNALIRELKTCSSNELTDLEDKFLKVIKGNFRFENGQLYYNEGSNYFNSYNLATGMKIFAILKLLLCNNKLSRESFIIFDEPETHVHPEWLPILAELLVCLNSIYNIQMLITTHSPEFCLALETYLNVYDARKESIFYTLQHKDDKSILRVADDLNRSIYEPFSSPLLRVQMIRDRYLPIDEEDDSDD